MYSKDTPLPGDIFRDLIDKQIGRCRSVLGAKGETYALESDALHNFRVTAELRRTTLMGSVSGMMSKHTVRLYDMMESGDASIADWREVIGDSINYLLILSSIVEFEELLFEASEPKKDSETQASVEPSRSAAAF